ncbi:MAG TPA: hypothetical protein VKZ49_08495 [Polyangiaceae bacterium]|nr:hypothetical protein [Polyangiaceae bacterium]
MENLTKATQAALLLKNRLRNAAWLHMVELGLGEDSEYCVRVHVANFHPDQRIIPRVLLGVRVHVGLVN